MALSESAVSLSLQISADFMLDSLPESQSSNSWRTHNIQSRSTVTVALAFVIIANVNRRRRKCVAVSMKTKLSPLAHRLLISELYRQTQPCRRAVPATVRVRASGRPELLDLACHK